VNKRFWLFGGFLCLSAIGIFSNSYQAWAVVMHLQASMAEEVLSETVATATPLGLLGVLAGESLDAPFSTEDFEIQWVGSPLAGVKASLKSNTLQWVRVQEILQIPRARLVVELEDADAAQVSHAKFTQPAFLENRHGQVEIPVALISGDQNPISVTLKRGKDTLRGRLQVRMKSKKHRVMIDTSCSPFQLNEVSLGEEQSDWIFMGCRLSRVQNSEGRTSSLEIFIFWDNVGQTIQINGIDTPSSSVSIWPLRLASQPGSVRLKAGSHQVDLRYSIPERLHNGTLGFGAGPYDYQFQGNGENSQSPQLLVNLHGSYFLTEALQVVASGAMTLDSHNFTDLGLYLRLETARIVDKRVGIHLLLGAHAIGFRSAGQFYLVTSQFPQGIEATFYDAFRKNANLDLGFFIFPPISGNAYYNVWLRWGAEIFVQVNYYLWQTTENSAPFTAGSLGVSLGVPLLQFW